MSFKIEIDGYMAPYEYSALAVFFAELAKGAEESRKVNVGYLTGSPEINQTDDRLAVLAGMMDTTKYSPSVAIAAAHESLKTMLTDVKGDPVNTEPAEEAKPKKSRAKAEPKPAISTGEERVNPDEAQDAADEAAEAAVPGKQYTKDDVKAAIGGYVDKFTLANTQLDGPAIFKSVLGKPPAGEPYWKLSIVPQDQDTLAKLVGAWETASAADERFVK